MSTVVIYGRVVGGMRPMMRALRNVSIVPIVFIGVLLVCVQSSGTTGNILGRVIFPEESMKPMNVGVLIGVSNFEFQERRSDQDAQVNYVLNNGTHASNSSNSKNGTYSSNSSNSTQFKSDCMEDFECNVSWTSAEVNQTGKYRY
jgi:hypothetical protein